MIKVVLLGDSLIADHDWQSRMPSYKVYNFGYSRAMASGLLASLTQVKRKVASADVILIMVGTNDLLTGNYDFIDTLKKISIKLIGDYPTAEVLLNGLFPMEFPILPDDTITEINASIEALASQTGCCFLDTCHRLAGSDKQIFREDGIQVTDSAYEIWSRALLEYISFLIEDD